MVNFHPLLQVRFNRAQRKTLNMSSWALDYQGPESVLEAAKRGDIEALKSFKNLPRQLSKHELNIDEVRSYRLLWGLMHISRNNAHRNGHVLPCSRSKIMYLMENLSCVPAEKVIWTQSRPSSRRALM